MTKITPKNAALLISMEMDANNPIFLWGPPGIGKSAIVRKVAKDRGIECRDVRAILLDPVDLRGIPSVENGVTRWNPPAFLPNDGDGILFLDELNAAPPAVAAALYELVLDRKIGEYRLPDGWRIVAAGNGERDRAVTNRMPTPLANRFNHYELEVSVDDWVDWAATSDVHPLVTAFVKFRPGLLHDFDPKANSKAFPTPRSWEAVSRKVITGVPAAVELAAYTAAVGDGAAIEFFGFKKMFDEMPDIGLMLANPDGADIPNDSAVLYAVSTTLARMSTRANLAAVWTLARRIAEYASAEFAVLIMTLATRRDEDLRETPEFIDFADKYSEVFI